jgi:hypothetical protein
MLLVFAVGSAATLALPQAARADAPQLTPAGAPLPGATQSSTCPTDIPGTSVFATPINDGIELLFLAPRRRNVAEMRRRVRALSNASHVQSQSAVVSSETGAPAPAVAVRDVDGGAMLRLTPSDPEQVADLQAHAFNYAQRLAGYDCSLLRDTPRPGDVRKPAAPANVQLPPGIVPNVGGLTVAPNLTPTLGAAF